MLRRYIEFPYYLKFTQETKIGVCEIGRKNYKPHGLTDFYFSQYDSHRFKSMETSYRQKITSDDDGILEIIAKKIVDIGNLLDNIRELSISSVTDEIAKRNNFLLSKRREFEMIIRDFKIQELNKQTSLRLTKLKGYLIRNPELAKSVSAALSKDSAFTKTTNQLDSVKSSLAHLKNNSNLIQNPMFGSFLEIGEKVKSFTKLGGKVFALFQIFDILIKGNETISAYNDADARTRNWEDPNSFQYKLTSFILTIAVLFITVFLVVNVSIILGIAFSVSFLILGIYDLISGTDNLTNGFISLSNFATQLFNDLYHFVNIKLAQP